MICCAVSNSAALADWVMSPVCSRKSGAPGRALILSMASFSVPVTSWLAALLKPMWLSLIWTKLNSAAPALACACCAGSRGEELRGGYAAGHGPEQAGSGPGHAAEKVAAVDAVADGSRLQLRFRRLARGLSGAAVYGVCLSFMGRFLHRMPTGGLAVLFPCRME